MIRDAVDMIGDRSASPGLRSTTTQRVVRQVAELTASSTTVGHCFDLVRMSSLVEKFSRTCPAPMISKAWPAERVCGPVQEYVSSG